MLVNKLSVGARVRLLPHPHIWPKEIDGLEGSIIGYKLFPVQRREVYRVKIDCLARELHCLPEIIEGI